MPDLSLQRCRNHADREAAARCPECRQFFCRECITEHDQRVICAACLRRQTRTPFLRRRGWLSALRLGQCLLGLLLAWVFFYMAGEVLLAIPAQFHEGSIWQMNWLDEK